MSAAERLDALDEGDARAALTTACGASAWVTGMLKRRPFRSDAALMASAAETWRAMGEADIVEAFAHHPEIGASLDALRDKFASTAQWASSEQASVAAASEQTLLALRDGNVAYRERFGFIFIVCATGKSAAEMLSLLQARLGNEPDRELSIAAAEQGKITALRLAKLGAG